MPWFGSINTEFQCKCIAKTLRNISLDDVGIVTNQRILVANISFDIIDVWKHVAFFNIISRLIWLLQLIVKCLNGLLCCRYDLPILMPITVTPFKFSNTWRLTLDWVFIISRNGIPQFEIPCNPFCSGMQQHNLHHSRCRVLPKAARCMYLPWNKGCGPGRLPPHIHQGAVSIRKTVLLGMAIPMLKIRRPTGRLIFNMGIPIPGKTVFYIETGPWVLPATKETLICDICRYQL